MATHDDSTLPAQAIGRYRLVRRVGSGATGEVFLASDDSRGREVALKLHRPPGESGLPAFMQRFDAEVRVLAALRHPDIVEILDSGHWRGRPWLATAWLPGHELTRYTSPARLLPETIALEVAERVARALAHAHRQGVLHRDVKPANVRIHLTAGRVTLTDFGIARLGDAAQTDTGVVPGTPAYMAPEQLAGAPPDAGADVYGLGVTLFQLLAGHLPCETPSMGELLRRSAREPAPDLRELRPALPPALARLVARLIARERSRRERDAAAVAEALASVRRAL
jgi:serine/threonine-protein kinase